MNWLENEDISREFADRGGSPMIKEVIEDFDKDPDSFPKAYQMDIATTRYGIPRANKSEIRKQAMEQAELIISSLDRLSEVHCPHSNRKEFQETYRSLIIEQQKLFDSESEPTVDDLVDRLRRILTPKKEN